MPRPAFEVAAAPSPRRPAHRGWAGLVIVGVLLALGACGTALQRGGTSGQGRPDWIDNPGDGASASANFHVNGRQAQEELAASRAREELAKRLGVTVSSDHLIRQTVNGDVSSSVSDKTITEELRGKEVRALVKAKWTDPSGVLWVWVVPTR